jgi:dienelactone hydrolase
MKAARRALLLFLTLTLLLLVPVGVRCWRAQRLLRGLVTKGLEAPDDLRVEELTIPGRDGPIRARLYARVDAPAGPGLVVAHGVHHRGIERLVPFARAMARAGQAVLTPALDDLADYRIDGRSVGQLVDSVTYLCGRRDRVSEARVGLVGFSFGGGLALLAAGEPRLRGRLSRVVSIGGYHDLSRVLGFFLTGVMETPDGPAQVRPHEYGPLVLLLRHLDALVPARDRRPAREALRAWLREDRGRARALAARLTSAQARGIFAMIERQSLEALRPRLEALLVADRATLEALSPRDKLDRIEAPVYLLHGRTDAVIPASETRWAELELDLHEHLALVSPLLEHVEMVREASVGDQLELVLFVSQAL